ncbi:hypothetical protein D3C85_945280 [compost metagenome]
MIILQAFQSPLDVSHLCAAVTGVHQHFSHEHAHGRRVLDDQYVFAGALRIDSGGQHFAGRRIGAGRQHDGHFGAAPRHAADVCIATGLTGETIDGRQPEPGALTQRFGSEERIEHLVDHAVLDTGAVVAHRQRDIRAIGQVGITMGIGRIGVDPDIAALGQGIARVDHQIEHGAFQLDRVDQGNRRFARQFKFQGNAFADGPHQQFFKGADVLVDINGSCVERLLPGECQQAMGQGGRTHRRVQRRFGIELNLVGTRIGDTFLDQFQAGDDAGEQIVEVVGNAAGELAQCVHFLHLQQLGFSAHAFGDFLGQLSGGVVQPRQVRALAVAVLGDILDKHQAEFR